ncbi:MAG: hypothetical protein R3D00_14625 [Bacteroidia bacterium]
MKINIIFFLLCGSGIFLPVFSQEKSAYEQVIAAAIEYRELQDFLESGQNGEALIEVVAANNRIPQTGNIHAFNRPIMIVPEVSNQYAYAVEICKIHLNEDKARLSFLYNHNLKAKFHLRNSGDQWEVSGSWLRLRKTGERGQKIRRFHWDF